MQNLLSSSSIFKHTYYRHKEITKGFFFQAVPMHVSSLNMILLFGKDTINNFKFYRICVLLAFLITPNSNSAMKEGEEMC